MEVELNVEKCPVVEKKKYVQKKCQYGKFKYRCVECNGIGICKHKKRKDSCKICKGSSICIHDKNKRYCIICNETYYCIHNKDKRCCKNCGGNKLCRSSFCHTRGIRKYNMYCLTCTINLFPEIVVKRNYKTKENHVVSHIKNNFPNFDFIADKRIEGGCSKKRPDLFFDYGSHIIIIEVDEFQHKMVSCEEKRTIEILEDNQWKNTIFIRFNPDSFYLNDKKILSCWKCNKLGVLTIAKGKENEWKDRLQLLIDTIQFHIENEPTKPLTVVKLFY